MKYYSKPLLLGYIRSDVLLSEAELTSAEAALEAFASSATYSLGDIYVEKGATPGAFDALMTEATSDETTWGVVVPDLRHLTEAEQAVLRGHNGGGHTPILVAGSPRREDEARALRPHDRQHGAGRVDPTAAGPEHGAASQKTGADCSER